MPDPVGSTSWPKRHARSFHLLGRLLASRTEPVTILLAGPGAVTRLMQPFLHDASERRQGWLARFVADLVRVVDQCLRRIPRLSLVSLEPRELAEVLSGPCRLQVVDVSRRVLEAVRRDWPAADCRRIDLASEPLPAAADVVIAFNVVSRTRDPEKAVAQLLAAVSPGGLLLIEDRAASRWLADRPDFRHVGEKVYRRGD